MKYILSLFVISIIAFSSCTKTGHCSCSGGKSWGVDYTSKNLDIQKKACESYDTACVFSES